MTIISSKKSINSGVKSMTAKAMSWSQVCKAISGIGGYVEIGGGEKVRPLELMQSLGVHVAKNSYKPGDIFAAWSPRMMDGKVVCMSHSVPFTVNVYGVDYTLHTLTGEKYTRVSKQALCRLVSATDKEKGSTDVVVSPANILRGLQQSVFVDDTLARIEKSVAKCAALTSGYVNISTDKKVEQWVRVIKAKDGSWSIEPEKAVKTAATTKDVAKKSGTRKGAKKAA